MPQIPEGSQLKLNWMQLIDYIKSKINKFHSLRDSKDKYIMDPFDRMDVAEWIVFEREELWKLINTLRSYNNLSPVTIAAVIRFVDTPACGHSDYVNKLAIYAAEMVEGRR